MWQSEPIYVVRPPRQRVDARRKLNLPVLNTERISLKKHSKSKRRNINHAHAITSQSNAFHFRNKINFFRASQLIGFHLWNIFRVQLSYKDSGVDISAGDDLVQRIKPLARGKLNLTILTETKACAHTDPDR